MGELCFYCGFEPSDIAEVPKKASHDRNPKLSHSKTENGQRKARQNILEISIEETFDGLIRFLEGEPNSNNCYFFIDSSNDV